MISTAQQYLIDTTDPLVTGYSETLPKEGTAVVYRPTGGSTVKSIGKHRQYSVHPFTAIVRGEKDSVALQTLVDNMVATLDMSSSASVIQCNVTSEPAYAFKDDNGNLHYSFNVDVLV